MSKGFENKQLANKIGCYWKLAEDKITREDIFTVGEDEVKAWPIRKGTPALYAAGEVHSDIQQGFIRAEVVAFEDLKASGSFQEAKKAGLVRLEGKEYEVKDGDIINYRFNV